MKNIVATCLVISSLTVFAAAENIMSLEATKWAEDPAEGDIVINFETGNKIEAVSGCIRFAGTYIQDGNTLTIGPMTRVRSLSGNICAELKVKFNRLVSVIKAIQSAKINDQKLILRAGEGKVLLKLQRHNIN